MKIFIQTELNIIKQDKDMLKIFHVTNKSQDNLPSLMFTLIRSQHYKELIREQVPKKTTSKSIFDKLD